MENIKNCIIEVYNDNIGKLNVIVDYVRKTI